MNIKQIYQDDSCYPFVLKKYLADGIPTVLSAIGDLNILQNKTFAIFSSIKCPGDIILKTYDLMRRLRDTDVTVIGGFHSPMERECLNILLRGKQPVIICPARSIDKMRIKVEYKELLEEGRLLILSSFSEKENRITAERATRRNTFIAAIADTIFIAYAEPNGKTKQFCRDILIWGKTIYTVDSEANNNLISMGVKPIEHEKQRLIEMKIVEEKKK